MKVRCDHYKQCKNEDCTAKKWHLPILWSKDEPRLCTIISGNFCPIVEDVVKCIPQKKKKTNKK